MHAQSRTLSIAVQKPRVIFVTMKFVAAFLLSVSLASAAAQAANWRLIRHEGRDYVTLENIAEFYGFPAPPALPVIPAPETAAPTAAGPAASSSDSTSAPSSPPKSGPAVAGTAAVGNAAPPPPPAPVLPKSIALTSDKWQLEVTLNSREVMINGVKQWLAFPAVVHDSKL